MQSINSELEQRLTRQLLDVFVRTGLILALVVHCYQIFAPFLNLVLWGLIMAINLFPLHQWLTQRMGGRAALASVTLVLVGAALFIAPTAFLMNSLGDSVGQTIEGVKNNTLQIPPPPAAVADWPILGKKIYPLWSQASQDLPGLVASLQPKIGDLAKSALAMVASLGLGLIQFFASTCLAGILVAQGPAGQAATRALAHKVVGPGRGEHFTNLCTSTIRAVARGVIGVAFIQALLVGLCFTLAGIPAAGLLALVTLVLGIAQAPAALVTLPAIAYVWMAGGHSTPVAVMLTLLLLVAGMADNFLKPMLLGRGVDAPMPVVLVGALGGMANSGILGLFVGSTLLTLGYQILMDWVQQSQITNPHKPEPTAGVEPPIA